MKQDHTHTLFVPIRVASFSRIGNIHLLPAPHTHTIAAMQDSSASTTFMLASTILALGGLGFMLFSNSDGETKRGGGKSRGHLPLLEDDFDAHDDGAMDEDDLDDFSDDHSSSDDDEDDDGEMEDAASRPPRKRAKKSDDVGTAGSWLDSSLFSWGGGGEDEDKAKNTKRKGKRKTDEDLEDFDEGEGEEDEDDDDLSDFDEDDDDEISVDLDGEVASVDGDDLFDEPLSPSAATKKRRATANTAKKRNGGNSKTTSKSGSSRRR